MIDPIKQTMKNKWESNFFSDEDIAELKSILEKREHIPMLCNREMHGIWLHDENWESELRLSLLLNFRLTVSRVCFLHRRQGTMMAVLYYLNDFCHKHKIPELLIQCVETPEMVNWCNKNGFSPDPNASFELDGYRFGDYKMHFKDLQ